LRHGLELVQFKYTLSRFLFANSIVAWVRIPAALRIKLEVIFRDVINLNFHFLSHAINVFLGVFNHFKGFLPFFFKLLFRFLYFLWFKLDPFLQGFFLTDVSSWWVLLIFVHFLDKLLLLGLSIIQGFLSHFYQVHKFVIFKHLL